MSKIRIGIVGAGANTRAMHIPGFQKIPDVEIVGVVNRSRESSQRVADEFSIGRIYDTWEELVRDDAVDAVCIGTWPYLHSTITVAALAAGKHVLTEARMAMDLEEAHRMQAAAQTYDPVAMIVPAPMWLDTEPHLLKLVADGFFGDFLSVQIYHLSGSFNPDAPRTWRQNPTLSGLNVMSMGILNETARRYLGDEQSVLASGRVFTSDRPDPDTGELVPANIVEDLGIVAELRGGGIAVYHIGGVSRCGPGLGIEAYGTKGVFKLIGDQAWIAGPDDDDVRLLEVPEDERGGWRVEEDFIDAIRDGKEVTRTSFADGVKYMEFTEAVHKSMNEGRRIQLPLG